MARSKHRARRFGRGALIVGVVVALLAVGTGSAFAMYDRSQLDKILPGVRIEGLGANGVDLSGMTRAQAEAVVTTASAGNLAATITVTAGPNSWTVPLSQLGVSIDVGATVDRALQASGSFPWVSRVYHRIMDRPVAVSIPAAYRYDRTPVDAFVAGAAKKVKIAPRNASITIVSNKVRLTHATTGKALQVGRAEDALAAAVLAGSTSVALPLTVTKPKVPDTKLGKTIVVDVFTNRLTLYDGLKVERRYPVATAKQGWVTPDGTWHVVRKAENPTWYNPAPDGWAKDLPLVVPPGPGNPLGTRALYLDAPGLIRIHGTPEDASIGHWESHGCVRMHISDSEAMYPLVPVGAKVLIFGWPPWGIDTTPLPAG